MNDGFINEIELIDYINCNSWNSLNSNIKKFLMFTFGSSFNANQKFIARKCDGGQVKPDLLITHNGVSKYVSVKKGSGNSVHQEKISVFFPLIGDMFGEKVLNNLKLFHYGDGTIDDTGKTRLSASECQYEYSREIRELNLVFNKPDSLVFFLNRFLFIGNVSSTLIVDVVYHGTIDSGLWASRDELINYFTNNNFTSNALHFGSLTYQVWGRNNDFVAVHPDRRYVMQVKWGSCKNDLMAITRKR